LVQTVDFGGDGRDVGRPGRVHGDQRADASMAYVVSWRVGYETSVCAQPSVGAKGSMAGRRSCG
jgi:hypothetical protein